MKEPSKSEVFVPVAVMLALVFVGSAAYVLMRALV